MHRSFRRDPLREGFSIINYKRPNNDPGRVYSWDYLSLPTSEAYSILTGYKSKGYTTVSAYCLDITKKEQPQPEGGSVVPLFANRLMAA